MSQYHDTHSPSHATSTRPSRVNDMMAHLEPDRVASESPLPSHASRVRYGGTVLEHLVRVIAAMQNDERKGNGRKQAKADRVGGEVTVRAEVPRKRKLDSVDIDSNNLNGCDKENISPLCVPSTKRICREKTGTEWQTVLDVIKYGEEVLLRSKPL